MVSNGQRAVWTFLMYALIGPFLAALATTFVVGLAAISGLDHLLPVPVTIGDAALASFVWSAIPAVLTGLVLAAVVWRSGGLSWVVAASIGVIAFAFASMMLPLDLHDARPYLAFLAGLVAVGVRQALIQADIITE